MVRKVCEEEKEEALARLAPLTWIVFLSFFWRPASPPSRVFSFVPLPPPPLFFFFRGLFPTTSKGVNGKGNPQLSFFRCHWIAYKLSFLLWVLTSSSLSLSHIVAVLNSSVYYSTRHYAFRLGTATSRMSAKFPILRLFPLLFPSFPLLFSSFLTTSVVFIFLSFFLSYKALGHMS